MIELNQKGEWRLDINELKNVLRDDTKLLVMNFPHNPTGQIMTQLELDAIINMCRQKGIWLFSDEVYHGIGDMSAMAQPVAACYEKGLSLNVMSKSYGMPGLRIGWIACQDRKLLQKIRERKHYTTICNSAPSGLLATVALSHSKYVLARNNELVKKNLTQVDQFIADHQINFRGYGRVEERWFVRYTSNESANMLCERVRKEIGILLLPGSVYGRNLEYFRIGFGRKNTSELLARLSDYLKKKGNKISLYLF